jgi:hypothetical protein
MSNIVTPPVHPTLVKVSPSLEYAHFETGLLALRISGDWISQIGALEISQMVANLKGAPINRVFVDLSDLETTDSNSANVAKDAIDLQRIVENGVSFAFYAPMGTLGYGLSRILAAFSDPENKSKLQACSDPDQALKSLRTTCNYATLCLKAGWT